MVVGGSVGGWVGEYVLVRMCVCVVCADSLRSVPQDKNGAQQLHQVKRMLMTTVRSLQH